MATSTISNIAFPAGDILYSQDTASGSWGTFETKQLAHPLSDYKLIEVCSYHKQDEHSILLATSIAEVSKFGTVYDTINAAYSANVSACVVRYINDTSIGVSTIQYGCMIIGIK